MTRVLLINLGSLPMPGNEPIFPIGLRCIEEALRLEGHSVRMMDFVEHPEALKRLDWVVDGWDVIGFAVRNIDPIDLACGGHVPEYEKFFDRVRNILSAERPLLVVGGAGYSLFANTLLKRFGVDVGVVGPGEAAMLEIAKDPERYMNSSSVMVGERYGGFVERAMSHPSSLMQAYSGDRDAMIGVETLRRTCFQKCVYCPYAYISGDNSGDHKPIEMLEAEIDSIYAAGFRRIFFTDAIFNSQRAAKGIVRMLADSSRNGLTWSAYFSPKPFDDELAELLKVSGVECVVVSPDSLDSRVMRVLGKNFDLDSVKRFVEKCRLHDLRPKLNVVFGGPGETRESVANTAHFANEMLHDDELSLHIGYRILPKTSLAAQSGLDEEDLVSPTFVPFDDDILQWIVDEMDGRFLTPSVMLNILAGRASARRMEKLARPAGISAAGKEFSHVALRRESV